MAWTELRPDSEGGAVRSPIGAKPTPVRREYRTELHRVGDDDKGGIRVVHWDIAVPVHEPHGVLMACRLESDDRHTNREQELYRQGGRGASSREQMACLRDNGFSR